MLETLDHTIRIGSTPTFLYFDLYVYVSLIVLVYLCKLFYTSYSVFTIICTIACPTVAIKSLFSIRHYAVDTCKPKRTYFFKCSLSEWKKKGISSDLR